MYGSGAIGARALIGGGQLDWGKEQGQTNAIFDKPTDILTLQFSFRIDTKGDI